MRKSLFSVMFSSALVIALLCTVCGAGRISAANNEQPQQQPESFEIQSTPDEGAAQYIITKQIYSEKNITINERASKKGKPIATSKENMGSDFLY